jgi:predicted ester cyclase
MIDAGEQIEVVRRWVAAFNQLDLAALRPYSRPDLQVHAPSLGDDSRRGLDRVAALLGAYRLAFPDGRFEVDQVTPEGELWACDWTARGVNRGPVLHLPASQTDAAVRGRCLFRFVDGLVAEHWFDFDLYALLEQCGALVAAPGWTDAEQRAVSGRAMDAWLQALRGGARAFGAFDAGVVVQANCFDMRLVEVGHGVLDKLAGYIQTCLRDVDAGIDDAPGQGRTTTYRGRLSGFEAGAGERATRRMYCMLSTRAGRVVTFRFRVGRRLDGPV